MRIDPKNRSEHGLAHVIPPRGLTRDEFIGHDWTMLLAHDLDENIPEPEWLDDPILSQITITSPRLAAPFQHLNTGRPWVEQIKPFNFIVVAHLAPLGHPDGVDPHRFRLITTYNKDTTGWANWAWRNIYDPHGAAYWITTSRHDATQGPRPNDLAEVQTFRTLLHSYQRHPEAKYADATGRPCSRATRGPLHRRHVQPRRVRVIGKETNELDQAQVGLYGTINEIAATYQQRDLELSSAVARLRHLSGRQIADAVNANRRTIDRIRHGASPGEALRERLIQLSHVVGTG